MRNKLKNIGFDTRERYSAKVGRMGIKSNDFKGFPERTILLKNVIFLIYVNYVCVHFLSFTKKK